MRPLIVFKRSSDSLVLRALGSRMSRVVLGNLESGGWGGLGRRRYFGRLCLGPNVKKGPLSAISPPIVAEDTPLSHEWRPTGMSTERLAGQCGGFMAGTAT